MNNRFFCTVVVFTLFTIMVLSHTLDAMQEAFKGRNASESKKNTLIKQLYSAITHGDGGIVQALVPNFVGANDKDPDGLFISPLACATYCMRHTIMNYLLEHGADVNIRTNNNSTLMHRAAAGNDEQAVILLKAYGANQDVTDDKGFTPLDIALAKGYEKLANILLDAQHVPQPGNRQPLKKQPTVFLKKESQHPQTLNDQLFDAIAQGDVKKIDALMAQGAEIKDYKGELFPTALHCAIASDHPHLIGHFVKKGYDVNYASKQGFTLLHFVACAGELAMVKELLNYGINIDAQQENGDSALFIAMRKGQLKTAEYLILQGAKAVLPYTTSPLLTDVKQPQKQRAFCYEPTPKLSPIYKQFFDVAPKLAYCTQFIKQSTLFDIACEEDAKAGNNDRIQLLIKAYKQKQVLEMTTVCYVKPHEIKTTPGDAQLEFTRKLQSFPPDKNEILVCPLAFLVKK